MTACLSRSARVDALRVFVDLFLKQIYIFMTGSVDEIPLHVIMRCFFRHSEGNGNLDCCSAFECTWLPWNLTVTLSRIIFAFGTAGVVTHFKNIHHAYDHLKIRRRRFDRLQRELSLRVLLVPWKKCMRLYLFENLKFKSSSKLTFLYLTHCNAQTLP